MILREVMITLKYGGKAHIPVGSESVYKWVGGSPMTVYPGSGNYASGTLNLGNVSPLGNDLYDLTLPDTSAFSLQGEYDLADWLMAAQPTFTGGTSGVVGIAFDPVWGLKTDPATPDGTKYVTVLFFPCIVILSLDNSDKAAFGSSISMDSWNVGDSLSPVRVGSTEYVFWGKSGDSTPPPLGKVLAKLNNTTYMVYFHG